MFTSVTEVPTPKNEPVQSYAPGTKARESLAKSLAVMHGEGLALQSVIGGEPVQGTKAFDVRPPHRHNDVVAKGTLVDEAGVQKAVDSALAAKSDWTMMDFDDRAAIMLRAADLLAGPYRDRINAATMLGQSKTCHQSEIDAACELIDFLRFNVAFARDILSVQPQSSAGIWNRTDYRGLDGFVLAITPFNFTAIAGNLCTAPALMGNTVVWKPANTQALSAHVFMEVLQKAGLPKGVINMVFADGPTTGKVCMNHPELGGVHFTGSTGTFQHLWKSAAENIQNYRAYPRLVGETGGKDFIFAHPSASVEALTTAIIRGGYEYQGQKCSAASRLFIPKSLWSSLKERLIAEIAEIPMGDVSDFGNFMSAVIDRRSFDKLKGYIDRAHADANASVLAGGSCDDSDGYFVKPTLVEVSDPMHELMREELFGPVVTAYVYDDGDMEEALRLCDESTPYALTGAVFAQDRQAIAMMSARLRFAAGNFYINDKPTGAVVGQQPFGGSRASGTNDKAGSALNLMRWTSPRSVKETFVSPIGWRYPFMG